MKAMQDEHCSPEEIEDTLQTLLRNFHFVPAAGKPLQLITMRHGAVVSTGMIDSLIAGLPRDTSALFMDPLVRTHALDENDQAVATPAGERVREGGVDGKGASVLASHHVAKSTARERVEDQYSARGSGTFVDAPRVSWRLLVANEADVKNFDIDRESCGRATLCGGPCPRPTTSRNRPPFWLRRQGWDFDRWEPRMDAEAQKARETEQLWGLGG